MNAPQIFSYLDYRLYLREWLAHQREQVPGYSFEAFAAAAGLSRSALPNVLKGSRSPKSSTLDGFGRALALSPNERNFLGVLVELDKAPSISQRNQVVSRILGHASFGKTAKVEERPTDYERYAAKWYQPVIHELARLNGFRADAEWVAKTLMPPVTVAEAQDALDTLIELGIIKVAADGSVTVTAIRIQTDIETRAKASLRFHQESVPIAIRKIDAIPAELRHLVGGVLLLPEEEIPEVKQMIDNLLTRIADKSDGPTGPNSRAYHLAIQLVPVSQSVS